MKYETEPGIFRNSIRLDADHIAAFLETKAGIELSEPRLEPCGGGANMFIASYVDRLGAEVSIGFVIPPDRMMQVLGLIAITLRDHH